MNPVPVFQANHTSSHAHFALHEALAAVERAQHSALLWFGEILRRHLYRELGYSSMQAYASAELKFSPAKTRDFMRLADKLEGLPRLKASVACGKVGYTKAREVIKVATPRTEAKWVEAAMKSTRQVLTAKVARVRKKALLRRREDPNQGQLQVGAPAAGEMDLVREVPVRINLEMSPEQFARYEAMWEKLHKLGGVPIGVGRVEVLLEALAGRVGELRTLRSVTADEVTPSAARAPRGAESSAGDSKAPHFQVHVHQCPDCQRATVQTSAGEKRIGPSDLQRVTCDAVITRPGQRARSAIPPQTRREVLNRDRHRCQGPGCTHTRFLEIHHKRPVSRGGDHSSANLITLCGACHRFLHQHAHARKQPAWA